MRKPSFAIVTTVLTILAIFGFAARLLRDFVPAEKANALANASEPFLAQGGEQSIDWQRLDPQVFARAASMNRPILMIIGSGASYLGRQFDSQTLKQGAVMGMLRRSFVCVRVDADYNARWINAILPVTRAKADYLADIYVLVLNPQGRLLRVFQPSNPGAAIDFQTFLDFLSRAARAAVQPLEGTTQQDQDVSALEQGGTSTLPSLAGHLATLIAADNPQGGFPVGPSQHLLPLAWRFLLLQGRTDAFESSLRPVLTTPVVNLIDGGFFAGARSTDWTLVDYDEVAELDAEMMWTLALAASATGNGFYQWLAQRTFDRLANDFTASGGIAAWQKGDEGPQDRSVRNSFPPRELRNAFPDSKERDWVQERLEMRVPINPLMSPSLVSEDVWKQERDHLQAAIQAFARARSGTASFGPDDLLEVNGLVSARLISAARLWNDSDRLSKALALADRLEAYRTADDVTRTSAAVQRVRGTLIDYLAYADSCLESFLATGRIDRFQAGDRVLRRTLYVFKGSAPGLYPFSIAPDKLPPSTNPPEILDHYRESATAVLIRLCLAYGQLEGTSGRDLTSAAYQASAHFADLANQIGPFCSGLFCATARAARAEIAVCVGPKSDTMARALYQISPSRIVAVGGGPVRPDLEGKPAGIYIIRGEEASGPYSLAEAAARLPLAFPFDVPAPQ